MWSPPAIAGQPCSWAPVGAAKLVSNQARVGAEKRSSTVPTIADHGTAGVRQRVPGGYLASSAADKRSRSRVDECTVHVVGAPCAARYVRAPVGDRMGGEEARDVVRDASSTSQVMPSSRRGISDGLRTAAHVAPVVADERPHERAVLAVSQRPLDDERTVLGADRVGHRELAPRNASSSVGNVPSA